MAYSDRVAFPWFAPAGLNRGGLNRDSIGFDVLMPVERLTAENRDDLYENRINPIASFPGQGHVIWGQKTLQLKSSALDRINVRRLMIKAKKLIASAVKFLVFEPNNAATQTRFRQLVNPILADIQQKQGLEHFRVVMDETTNTPDLIDRNIMAGKIFLVPTRAAEFISLDFVISPSGATFED
jgi:phage tail sheath protein FI